MRNTPPSLKKQRESNFELLRLLAQFFIVSYHLLIHYVQPTNDDVIYKALQLPLHIGVVIFILISGYFSINATSKAFIKLIGIFGVYSVAEVIYNISIAKDVTNIIKSLLFFSNTHYWFIKTYTYLFLISPLLNCFWRMSTNREKVYITFTLGFIAIYMPTVLGDNTLSNGKNLVNFMFIYYVGRMLYEYNTNWMKVKNKIYILCYLLLNVTIVLSYMSFHSSVIGNSIWHLAFPYSSIILLINSVLFFIIIGKIKFHSTIVNYLATSSLAIYLIHSSKPYMTGALEFSTKLIFCTTNNHIALCLMCLALVLLTMIISIIIDKLLSPVWVALQLIGDKLYVKLGF